MPPAGWETPSYSDFAIVLESMISALRFSKSRCNMGGGGTGPSEAWFPFVPSLVEYQLLGCEKSPSTWT